jgi:hypothetical protein
MTALDRDALRAAAEKARDMLPGEIAWHRYEDMTSQWWVEPTDARFIALADPPTVLALLAALAAAEARADRAEGEGRSAAYRDPRRVILCVTCGAELGVPVTPDPPTLAHEPDWSHSVAAYREVRPDV